MMAAGVFVAVAVAVLAGGAAALAEEGAAARLRRLLGFEPGPRPGVVEKIQQAMEPAARLLPPSTAEAKRTRLWLMQAGYREARHERLYFGVRALLVVAPAALAVGTGWWRVSPALALVAPLFGWLGPRLWLKRRIRARGRRIRLSLPDALDLLAICVEAGLGLDQAVQRVAEELKPVHPDLCGELELLELELRAGVARAQALRNLTERCLVEDLRNFAAVLIQTDRFGTSVSQTLRVHSAALRLERRQRVEEEAAKLSIKMLPVLALFVFPAVMVVIMGPAVIALVRHLGPMLTQ